MAVKKLLKSSLFITLGIMATSSQIIAKDYKLGVVLFPNKSNMGEDLDKIKSSIASNDVYRERNGDTLQLLVQSEISWHDTNPNNGKYNFDKFINFAKSCKERGIKWTPLFSPHYVPNWVYSKYEEDRITDKHGNKITNHTFLRFSPSSKVWDTEVKKWIEKGLEALSPYIGIGKNNTISEVFVTNEMTYPRGGLAYGDDNDNSKISTYDKATIEAWNKRYKNQYGVIPRNITKESRERRNAFLKFRSEELAYCLARLKSYTDDKLKKLGKSNIPVTWKLTPYVFDKGANTLEQYMGLMGSQVSYLFNKTNLKMIAFDEYEGGSGWQSFKNSLNTIKRFNNSTKPIYLAEFNNQIGYPESYEIKNWILNTKKYGVSNWTYFSWNGEGEGNKANIEVEQKIGLKEAFDTIIAPDGASNDPSGHVVEKVSKITIPSNGSTLTSSSITFKCQNTNAKNYYIYIGTSKGGNNIHSGYISKSTLSKTVKTIPINGNKIYVRLWTQTSSGWKHKDFSYKTKKTFSTTQNKYIEKFYNEFSWYFGKPLGSNYSCGQGFICQKFQGGYNNIDKKIKVKTSNNYLYWYNGKWNRAGIRY